MGVVFDPAKNAANKIKHGIFLADFVDFDDAPVVVVDGRFDYGETRYRAFGRIGGAGYCLVFTFTGDHMRLMSFRRAHEKEMRRYE